MCDNLASFWSRTWCRKDAIADYVSNIAFCEDPSPNDTDNGTSPNAGTNNGTNNTNDNNNGTNTDPVVFTTSCGNFNVDPNINDFNRIHVD